MESVVRPKLAAEVSDLKAKLVSHKIWGGFENLAGCGVDYQLLEATQRSLP